jgi:hypothetical protein
VRATARISRRPCRPVLNSVATRSNSSVYRKTPDEAGALEEYLPGPCETRSAGPPVLQKPLVRSAL